MRNRASNSDRAELESLDADLPEWKPGPQAFAEGGAATSVVAPLTIASHDALFAPADVTHCDACGCDLDDGDGSAREPAGLGIYMWTRGPEVRFEEAPLCASCASAIGMTALARWEIEEEEG
ncbi:MAG TPA: hypothetical protein VEK07_18630 [Polyangiaceae bacterium]|nr:hypothetical protein [Polyangiaceae bacterium]